MRPGAIVAGFILLGLGVAMLLDRAGLMQLHTGRLVPPLILIAMGSAIVLDKGGFVAECRRRDEEGIAPTRLRRRGGATGGVWLIGVGAWMLISQSHVFGLTYHTSWPIFIIMAGVIIVMRGMR